MSYKINDVAFGNIINITENSITVLTKDGYNFLILKKDITDWKNTKLNFMFNINEKINFIVLTCESKNNCTGSFKFNHPQFSRSPFEYGLNPTKGNFKKLKNSVDQLIGEYKNDKNKIN
ncbi:hypothetical protein [Mycoplasma crocodyli]|uniref:30S ribosomal protein S1 n=1 Tax=Mycoplasma crocodyli (strain ATCC 51981 / MP145) TaxID=512564 RepID=D5E5K4_MYCCM|nr:hypothetical protein [Mycoplasma crocodyli]ADE19708.1 30S ribosomal protein S1 [Mycoplasma crocodyli MP145]